MSVEEGIVVVFAALAVLPLLTLARRSYVTVLVVGVSCAAAALWLFSGPHAAPATNALREPVDRPLAQDGDGFVSSKSCRACHPHQYATWHASYHRTMTQVVSDQSVLGGFNDETTTFNDQEYRFFRRDGNFMAEVRRTKGGTEQPEEYQCVLSTGSHHMQVYWLAAGRGQPMARLPLAYLLSEKRWVPFDSTFLRPPGVQTSLEAGQWNMNCINCHTTNGQPGLKFTREGSLERRHLYKMETRVAEFGIACEACHGPSHQHVLEAKAPWTRYGLHFGRAIDENTVQPAKLASRIGSQVCGSCHSVTVARTAADTRRMFNDGCNYRAGDDMFDEERSDRVVVQSGLAHPGLEDALSREANFVTSRFWSDGVIRVSGREYNGLLESPCYQHGDEERGVFSCMSCHQMHQSSDDPRPIREWADDQLKVGMRTDLACTQCHAEFVDASRIADHTHHPVQSDGSRCYNCHMPHTTYGLLKAIRSHTVGSPSVQESVQTSRPNACNLCHLDKTLAWTGKHLQDWYGIEPPELQKDEMQIAAAVLWVLRGDAGQRALMAWTMGWEPARKASGEDWLPPYLAQLMSDPYDAVRYIAYHSLIRMEGFEEFRFDFMSSADRGDVVQRVRLMRNEAEDRPSRGDLLLTPYGEIESSKLARFLLQRDTRPVLLNE